jgi:hypothetical protein
MTKRSASPDNSPRKSNRYRNKKATIETPSYNIKSDLESGIAFGAEDNNLCIEFENEILIEIENALDKGYILIAATDYFNERAVNSNTVLYPIIGLKNTTRTLKLIDPLHLSNLNKTPLTFHITLTQLIKKFCFLAICEISNQDLFSSVNINFNSRNNIKYSINYTKAWVGNPQSVANIPKPINESNMSVNKLRITNSGIYTISF